MSEVIKNIVKDYADNAGLPLSESQLDALVTYAGMLVKTNEVMNLTNITDDEGIAVRHFVDSLTLVPFILEEQKKAGREDISVIDVGTGAGFPDIVLKIAVPKIRLTLLDSLQKRLNFLDEVSSALSLADVKTVHGRAEDAGHDAALREKYDVSCARAVANLPVLCEYCLPFVKTGGAFLAMKGNVDEEEKASGRALQVLGGKKEKVDRFLLPGTDMNRSIVVVRKSKPTPNAYPRQAGKPSKKPL
ncbi:MAG: 16S rRNA (guanine(527)-N(7))-methyltransferase RsmG [Clostridiales bacterium]|nr:16S rRNA (guanine(527)-N(7))-methyltransferase RsmG [Clostridiales bacterium]